MKIHRFIGDFEIKEKNLKIKDNIIIHQMLRVLKLKEDEKIKLSDGHGFENTYTIKKINKNELFLKTDSSPEATPEQATKVTIFMTILKKENFEIVVEKATELGVFKIIPIISSRTIKQNINIDRLKKIALEASEQSGRGEVPEIAKVEKFEDIIKRRGEFEDAWIFEQNSKESIKDTKVKNRAVIIGPEGGFTKEELVQAKKYEWETVSIGSLVLRAETAGIVGVYMAL